MEKGARELTTRERSRLKKIGLRIRQLRESKGLTLEAMVDAGYTSWVHLSAVEGGKKNITVTTLCRIADVLQVPVSQLLKEL
jgi:transcriptional regulator with XRE-family HTH domain